MAALAIAYADLLHPHSPTDLHLHQLGGTPRLVVYQPREGDRPHSSEMLQFRQRPDHCPSPHCRRGKPALMIRWSQVHTFRACIADERTPPPYPSPAMQGRETSTSDLLGAGYTRFARGLGTSCVLPPPPCPREALHRIAASLASARRAITPLPAFPRRLIQGCAIPRAPAPCARADRRSSHTDIGYRP